MKTAVIVPVKNEMAGLGELVDALRAQAGADDELVFVDAGSTDGTAETIRRFSETDPRIRLVVAPNAYPGAARNAGIRQTRADIIAQIDGSNMPEKEWLPRLIAPILRGEADYVSGNVECMAVPWRVFGRTVDAGEIYGTSLFRGPNARLREHQGEPYIPAGGASAAYRREVWERAGGFPEWLRFGSDPLYVEKVMQQKPRIAVAADAVLYWQIGPRLRDVARRQYRREVDHWRLPWGKAGRRWLGYLLVLAASLAAAMAWPPAWAAPAALVLLAAGAQAARSFVSYCKYARREARSYMVAAVVFPLVHLVEVGTRTWGTFTGLFLSRRIRADWSEKRRAYLSS
jgi:glycosyltransferase involved in cell wall biosynthesis